MRPPISILGLLVLLLWPASVVGQSRRNSPWTLPWHDTRADRGRDNVTPSRMETRINRRRPNVYGSAQAFRLSTRRDNLRNELSQKYSDRRRRPERGLQLRERPSMSRVARMMDRHNLLRSDSELARNRSALLGRQDYIREADGRWRGEVSSLESSDRVNLPSDERTMTPLNYSSRLSAQLEEKADQYYRKGVESFREGQYPRSRDYFQLVRQLEDDRPRAFVANVLVSLHGSDLNIAVTSLIHAIRRAESLADLKVDWKEFYDKEQDFQRIVNAVNVKAKSGDGTNKAMNLMLAYYSFLNGDLNTAIATVELAETQTAGGAPANLDSELDSNQKPVNALSAAAKRFGEFLVAARDQSEAPEGGG